MIYVFQIDFASLKRIQFERHKEFERHKVINCSTFAIGDIQLQLRMHEYKMCSFYQGSQPCYRSTCI